MQKPCESKIPDTIGGLTLRPNWTEFENFSDYIQKIEKQNLSFAKVLLLIEILVLVLNTTQIQ